jgi:hypothetical protein
MMRYKIVLTDGQGSLFLFGSDSEEEAESKLDYFKEMYKKAEIKDNIYVELRG